MKPENHRIKGHSFVYYNRPTYCDNCEDFMWTLVKPCAVRCKKCKYACHECCMASTNFECPKKKVNLKNNQPQTSPLAFTPYHPNSKIESPFKNNEKIVKGTVVNRQDQSSESSRPSVVNEKPHENISFDEIPCTQGHDSACSSLITDSPNDHLTKQLAMAFPYKYSSSEIFQRVFSYNRGSSGLALTMCQGSTNFRGFIRIKINLTRPVNVKSGSEDMTLRRALSASSTKNSANEPNYIAGLSSHYSNIIVNVPNDEKSPDEYDDDENNFCKSSNSLSHSKNKRWVRQTFHIPKETTSALHVRSDTTSRERKNPENPSSTMTTAEIPDAACPLMLLLEWGPLNTNYTISFSEKILKDNIYEHFSIPELTNFHKIITSEKLKAITKVDEKFLDYEKALNDVLNLDSNPKLL